jgi:hypothetical protein
MKGLPGGWADFIFDEIEYEVEEQLEAAFIDKLSGQAQKEIDSAANNAAYDDDAYAEIVKTYVTKENLALDEILSDVLSKFKESINEKIKEKALMCGMKADDIDRLLFPQN